MFGREVGQPLNPEGACGGEAFLMAGGFGGAVLALTQADFTAAQAAEILAPYTAAHGAPAETLHLQTADGARLAPND